MIEHDEQHEPAEQAPADEQQAPSGDAQSTSEANVDRDGPVAEDDAAADADDVREDIEPEAEVDDVEPEAIADLDDASDLTPADAVADSLKEALVTMREEADRIATLGTGEEQVAASEQFAEDAGKLDEQVGAAARAADDDRG